MIKFLTMLTNLIEHLKGKDIWWGICVLLLLGTFIFIAVYCLVTGKKPDHIEAISIALLAILNQLMGFRYGSSKGSKDKDKQNNQPA